MDLQGAVLSTEKAIQPLRYGDLALLAPYQDFAATITLQHGQRLPAADDATPRNDLHWHGLRGLAHGGWQDGANTALASVFNH